MLRPNWFSAARQWSGNDGEELGALSFYSNDGDLNPSGMLVETLMLTRY